MTERSPLPKALSHLAVIRRAGEVAGLIEAALWVDDSKLTMQSDSREYAWATGARHFLWQLADERSGIAPWSSDMHTARQFTRPIIVGKRGSKLMAMAIYRGSAWRHTDSLNPVCFVADVWHPLPKAAPA